MPVSPILLVIGVASVVCLHHLKVKANYLCLALFSGLVVLSYVAPAEAVISSAAYSLQIALIAEGLWRVSPWHPLATFPGPLWCKLTGFKLASVVNTGHRHVWVRELHRKYGKIIRTGPNTLSASSMPAVAAIYASSSAMPKSTAYAELRGGLKGIGMFTMRTKEEHALRRRTWTAAFSNQAMDKYQLGLERRTTQLLDILPLHVDVDGVVSLSTYILYWAFDLLCDIMSGCPRELEMLAKGDTVGFLGHTQQASKLFEIFSEIPWFVDLLSLVPGIDRINPNNVPEVYARQLIEERMNHACGEHDDLASYLLGEKGLTGENISPEDLVVDTLLALQAGADTVSATLTLLLYYVLSEPDVHRRLQEELDRAFVDPEKVINDRTLSELPYFSAVLEEAVRLGSPFHAVPRQVPESGAVVDGNFVPGGTVISVTSYVMHTAEEFFSPEPESFRPERWLPGGLGPDSYTNKTAVLAFSAGTFGCLGKNLAKRMLRYCAARLLRQFDLRLAPDFDGQQFLDGISHVRATIFEQPLRVVISPRK